MTQEERDKAIDLDLQRAALDEISARYKRAMQAQGYMVRMTEWHEGFQVCAFKRTDIRKCYVSSWCLYENIAWRETFEWAVKEVEGDQVR